MSLNSSRKFGLLGKTLRHSFSKDFFTNKFKNEDIDAVFENVELSDIQGLESWMNVLSAQFSGVNVTIPYKEAVIPFLDELSFEAQEIGAVNCIRFTGGKSIGYNTDYFGFHQSIKPFFKGFHERALIIGTGGAAKAVTYILKKIGVEVSFISRTPDIENQIYSYDTVNKIMVNSFLLIINTTPVGTFPKVDEKPNFPIHFVGEKHLVVDLIYNPSETLFLKIARENGAVTMNGYAMLQHQAIKSWEIWNQ